MPPPPKINEGLSINGNPISSLAATPSSIDLTYSACNVLIPALSIALLKSHLFSAISIDFAEAPKSKISFLSNTLSFSNSIDKLSAVCPPNVGKTASGCSISIIFFK